MKSAFILLMLVFVMTSNSYGEGEGAKDVNEFAKACTAAYDFGPQMCSCLAKKADKKFTPNGFAFLIAVMNDNHEKAKRIRTKLEIAESFEVGMFFINTPAKCAEEMNAN